MHRFKQGSDFSVILLEQFRIDPADIDLDPVRHPAMDQRFVKRFVSVLQADIFADHANRDLAFRMLVAIDNIDPAR